jgi:hypothetical protein
LCRSRLRQSLRLAGPRAVVVWSGGLRGAGRAAPRELAAAGRLGLRSLEGFQHIL